MINTARKSIYWVNLAILIVLLSGCVMAHLPSDKELGKVKSGTRSIVFLRITAEVDGKTYDPFPPIGLALGSFETGGELIQIDPLISFSAQTRKDGWVYFLLEAGQHYLAIQPPRKGHIVTNQANFKFAPLYRFYVPPKTEFVYVGTLHLQYISKKNLFGIDMISSFKSDGITVHNDEDIASKLASEFFPEFEIPRTMLMELHKGPIIFNTPTINE